MDRCISLRALGVAGMRGIVRPETGELLGVWMDAQRVLALRDAVVDERGRLRPVSSEVVTPLSVQVRLAEAQRSRGDRLLGRAVVAERDEDMGSVADMLFESSTGQLVTLVSKQGLFFPKELRIARQQIIEIQPNYIVVRSAFISVQQAVEYRV